MLYSHHVLSTPFTCANVCILGSVEASSTQCTPKAAAVHSERHRTTLLMPAQCTGIDNGDIFPKRSKRKSGKVWRFQDKIVFLQIFILLNFNVIILWKKSITTTYVQSAAVRTCCIIMMARWSVRIVDFFGSSVKYVDGKAENPATSIGLKARQLL